MEFLEKYTNQIVPSESSLHSNYSKRIYKYTIDNIRSCVSNRFLWISIDETTDAEGRYVANAIIGILDTDAAYSKKF